jgi:hypothetical protein
MPVAGRNHHYAIARRRRGEDFALERCMPALLAVGRVQRDQIAIGRADQHQAVAGTDTAGHVILEAGLP